MPGVFREEPRRRGVFYWRDVVLEGVYRTLERSGMRFAHRPARPPDYELLLERFYSRLPLEGQVALDVGAHIGRHASPLAGCVGPRGHVHAFEAVPHACKLLAERLRADGRSNVTIHACAISDYAGAADFCFLPGAPQESGLRPRATYNEAPDETETLTVPVMRLDDAIPRGTPVRFVKIDVEGGERDVMRGATRILDECRPAVAFECGARSYKGYHETPDEIHALLVSRGYSLHAITGQRIEDATHFRTATEVQEFWDYIALPPGAGHLASLLAPPRKR